MNLDQMMDSWRSQDEKPLYGVNSELLQLVLQHEQADIRRKLRLEHWGLYAASALLLLFSGPILFAYIYFGGSALNLGAAALATGAVLAGVCALWLSRRRQAQRERGFGNSLREEIKRNLSLLDYQLSRKGQTERALLIVAPVSLAAWLVYWLTLQVNHNPFGWYDAILIGACIVAAIWGTVDKTRKTERELLPRQRRLNQLLKTLNTNE